MKQLVCNASACLHAFTVHIFDSLGLKEKKQSKNPINKNFISLRACMTDVSKIICAPSLCQIIFNNQIIYIPVCVTIF